MPELYGDKKTTILAMEYWCDDDDRIWTEDEAATIALAGRELRQTGLIGTAKILDGKVYPIKRCYPVYDRNYKARLKPVEAYLSSIENLSVIGRYRAFKYNNQDHSILMGLLAADNICKRTCRHDLWEINTDYETYQEASHYRNGIGIGCVGLTPHHFNVAAKQRACRPGRRRAFAARRVRTRNRIRSRSPICRCWQSAA